MAKPSVIDQLNPEDKAWLDARFRDHGFCGYVEIAELLAERGYNVSKSSIHRYGQKLEQKMAAVQASTQAAMLIADAAPDDADMRSQAVISLMQTQLFNSLIQLQEAGDEADPAKRLALIAGSGKGIAEIMKASVNQKKWMLDVRDRVEKAAQAVDSIVKKGGLSAEVAADIRAQILGISKT
ncbi:terminase [Acinetobacter sp. ANC 4558]|uniref:DUF3486 family protein n=1 Tax=Acinetobacter sp. ANC 4558 TaxID=1977876 RepID=UPI000A352348|nr:DUF3486 family protein [Acinetobacter sp. ANC 4558]OTG87687.1 terminase [Acinetobacter sp. ANC 4558]